MSLNLTEKLQTLNPSLKSILMNIHKRYTEIKKKYDRVENYGYPLLESREEIAVIYYLISNKILSISDVSKITGLSRPTIYKIIKSVENAKPIRITTYVNNTPTISRVIVSTENVKELIEKVKTQLNGKPKHISDPRLSSVVKEFLEKPFKRIKVKGHGEVFDQSEINKTINTITKIMLYIKQKHPEYPTNPDLWNEDMLILILNEMYPNDKQRRRIYSTLRRIPKWREYFKGRIGATRNYVELVDRYLTLEDYIRLKKIVEKSNDPELRAVFLIMSLHIESKSREGWESCSDGSLDSCKSSLASISWENFTIKNDQLIQYKVYESKRDKWGIVEPWLDNYHIELIRIWKKMGRPTRGSVIKTILKYYGINITSVKEFQQWYSKMLIKVSKLLGLSYELKPHDMRRSGLTILWELGVPLELAVSFDSGFGSGWDDITIAYRHYLRLTRTKRAREVRAKIREAFASL